MSLKGPAAAVAYGVTSVIIVFVNKAVFQLYDYHGSNLLTLGQMVFSIVGLHIAKTLNLISFPDFSFSIAQSVFPLSLSFVLMVVTGLGALVSVNVPMYSALRRLATLLVILLQYYVLQKRVTRVEGASACVMVLGALIAGIGDLTFDLLGYVLVVINCLVTASYLVYISKVTSMTGLSTFGLMFYNNFLSIPVVFLIAVTMEGAELTKFASGNYPLAFYLLFLLSCVCAVLLNYFIYLCSTTNSPLATSIVGQLKAIVTTVFGLFAFNDVLITPLLVSGLIVSTVGGLWYGQEKYDQQMRAKKKVSARVV